MRAPGAHGADRGPGGCLSPIHERLDEVASGDLAQANARARAPSGPAHVGALGGRGRAGSSQGIPWSFLYWSQFRLSSRKESNESRRMNGLVRLSMPIVEKGLSP